VPHVNDAQPIAHVVQRVEHEVQLHAWQREDRLHVMRDQRAHQRLRPIHPLASHRQAM
jgi:hypothetical protein